MIAFRFGERIAIGQQVSIMIRNVASGILEHRLAHERNSAAHLVALHSGDCFAAVGNTTIFLWDGAVGLKQSEVRFRSHIYSVAPFPSDNCFVAFTTSDADVVGLGRQPALTTSKGLVLFDEDRIVYVSLVELRVWSMAAAKHACAFPFA